MDSVTQIALGATIAAVCVPKEQRRKAALMGAALGTLPDLDVLIDYGDAVSNFTLHRGFSHSLFVLVPLSVLLWRILKSLYPPVSENPQAWFWAIMLPLVTHPLLDAHTAYGTQLFWPLDVTPTMWSTLFIIDPLYTLPLLIATLVVLIKPKANAVKKILGGSLIFSMMYLSWSWLAKIYISQQVQQAYSETPKELKYFITPTPFNTLMWRIVVLSDEQYQEGYYHYLRPERIRFVTYSRNKPLLDAVSNMQSMQQLRWFADDYNGAAIIDGQLVISDLRMGFADNYAFRHVIANQVHNDWQEISSLRLRSELDGDDLAMFWQEFSKLE